MQVHRLRSTVLVVVLVGFSILLASKPAIAQGGVCYVELECCGCDGQYCYIYDQCYSPTGCYGPYCTAGNCSTPGKCEWECDSVLSYEDDTCSGVGSSVRPTPANLNSFNAIRVALKTSTEDQTDSTAVVKLDIAPSMSLELVKVEGPLGSPLSRYQYTLRNIGAHPIVALAIRWKIYAGNESVPRMSKLSTVDYWAGGPGDWFSPGQVKSFIVTEPLTKPEPVGRMEGTPVFIEFGDGTRYGSEAGPIFTRLTKERQEVQQEFRRAVSIYDTSGQQAFAYELAQAKTSWKTNDGRALAAGIILWHMQKKGTQATLAYLRTAEQLQIPK